MCEPYFIKKRIIGALVPIYHSSHGNATKIMYLGEDYEIVPRTIKTVLRNIAKENVVDIRASREKYGKLLGCGRAAPIPINRDIIFIPLKMRRTISKNDSARGYVNCLAIKDVQSKCSGPVCTVVLRDDTKVECFHSKKNIKQHISHCYFVRTKFAGTPEAGDERAEDYLDCPATKSDIAMLLKEIRRLRE